MKITDFLIDKVVFIFAQLFVIGFSGVVLNCFNVGNQAVALICFTFIIITVCSLLYEYIKKSRYYKRLYCILDNMECKQHIVALMEEPDFYDANILYDILKQTTKAMNDEIATHKIAQQEYREYIETWIHEVKLPIACIDLICKNNRSEVTDSIIVEMNRIDSFVEQALYYARSSTVEKDYSIRGIYLEEMVKNVAKKYARELIAGKCQLTFDNLDYMIFTDPKWFEFILGQIVSNSIKYKRESFSLSFFAEEKEKQVNLIIEDNGIGISRKDLDRVFEKSFTGENGRKFAKSTGMGLYLCKKLCDKLHLGIAINSNIDKGTSIIITFPKDKTVIFE